jgi:cleavage and polyadenylation specificity factor subunit 4
MTSNPLAGPSALRDIINPQFHQNNFPAEIYAKAELGIKLDKGRYVLGLTTLV